METSNTQSLTEQVHQYFQDHDIDTTNSQLNIASQADFHTLSEQDICTLMCNLENVEVMQDLVDGHPYSFDPLCAGDFNDSYVDMMDDMGLWSDEDEEEDNN